MRTEEMNVRRQVDGYDSDHHHHHVEDENGEK